MLVIYFLWYCSFFGFFINEVFIKYCFLFCIRNFIRYYEDIGGIRQNKIMGFIWQDGQVKIISKYIELLNIEVSVLKKKGVVEIESNVYVRVFFI